MADGVIESAPSREQLIHSLYEAVELAHNLMCTSLYPAFSLKAASEGLSALEAEAFGCWRRVIVDVAIDFETKRCIHSRPCVTGAPNVFLANVDGPWIHPNAIDAEKRVAIAEVCPSGAIRYRRNDGRPNGGGRRRSTSPRSARAGLTSCAATSCSMASGRGSA